MCRPKTSKVGNIIGLIDAGMSLCRLNCSHGTPKENQRMIRNYYQARKLRPFKTCSLMLDLKGRQVRTAMACEPPTGIEVDMGDEVTVMCNANGQSTAECIYVDLDDLMNSLRPGDKVSFNDGELDAVVIEVTEEMMKVQFKDAGCVLPYKSMRIPGHRLSALNVLRAEDKNSILDMAVKHKMDYIAIPNVTSVKDIQEAKLARGEEGDKLAVVAKIDNLEAVHQFEGILKYVDGIIVLRNELAFELQPEKLMLAQKWMIQTANMQSVPIFLQSQVLDTQIEGLPTEARQEAADISSAVLDGADAFILSNETSIGENPQPAAILLAKAIAEAEQVYDHEKAFQEARAVSKEAGKNVEVTDMLCSTATQIALDNNVDLFICLTKTGKIARFLARQRPEQLILCCSEYSSVVRQANMVRGVIGYKVPAYLSKCHITPLSEFVTNCDLCFR